MFVHDILLPHPTAVVWEAITRKREVDRYYLAPIGGDVPTAGGEIFYGTADNRLITGYVVESEAPHRLVHTFRFAGEGEIDSTVAYVLAAEGAATRLRIEHQGFTAGTSRHEDISLGWPIILDRLAEHLDARKR